MARLKYEKWIEKEGLLLLESWARTGLTDEQIAHNMGIARQTLYQWRKKYKVIDDTLKKGKEIVDIQVENALRKRALGYEYNEVTISTEKIPVYRDGETIMMEKTLRKVTTKMVVPDVTAQIYWLKNRRPNQWRDKQEYTDNTALDKLDNILAEVRQNAFAETE